MCPSPDALFPPPHSAVAAGRLAEELAASFLRLRGYRILERNLRDGPREIDLVAQRGAWLVVVEVRFRGRLDHGLPEESVGQRKQRHLLRAGRSYWLRRGRALGRLRYDLIAISLGEEGLVLRHHPHFLIPHA